MKKLSVLLKRGMRVARLDKADEKVCSGRELAEALAGTRLPAGEANAWRRALRRAHKTLKPPDDKWR